MLQNWRREARFVSRPHAGKTGLVETFDLSLEPAASVTDAELADIMQASRPDCNG